MAGRRLQAVQDKKRRKPGPPATGKTVKPIGVALRDGDADILQRLAAERLIIEAGGDYEKVIASGQRSSASAGIRHLIDKEYALRIAKARKRWGAAHPGEPAPHPARLLVDDYLFGAPPGPKMTTLVLRLEPYEIVDDTLQRAHDHELRDEGGGLKPYPKKKGKPPRS